MLKNIGKILGGAAVMGLGIAGCYLSSWAGMIGIASGIAGFIGTDED